MYAGRTIFAQLMDYLPAHQLRRCVARYNGDRRVRTFTCRDQFLCMAFAQLTYRESLRDIEACLRSMGDKLYHMGIRGAVSRATLADANERRDARIYADLAHVLMRDARRLYADQPLFDELTRTVYALDSTTIELCISLFPWAAFHHYTSAVKLHTLLDLRGNIPRFARVTHSRVHDVRVLDDIPIEPGAIYVVDRGYLDLNRLYALHQAHAVFVIRAKRDLRLRRRYSQPVDRSTGLRSDHTVFCTGARGRRDYPDTIRRIRYRDEERQKTLTFLTNDFTLPALTIANLYRNRWQIELFFRWIKEHLRIRSFFGTSANAVQTQIWIAMSVYLLVAIARQHLKLNRDLYTILQILSVSLFERMPLVEVLSSKTYHIHADGDHNQLQLFTL
jgi:hypothetical protein